MVTSRWKGSYQTASSVAQQIAQRFGEEAAREYNPNVNCFTFKGWLERGYFVKRGERALRSMTIVPMVIIDKVTKEEHLVKSSKNICLFFKTQVEPKRGKA